MNPKPASPGRAAVFTGPGRPLEIRLYPVARPAPGRTLLKLERSGICGTDLHIRAGRLPVPTGGLIIGHEFVGRVIELGPGRRLDGLGERLKVGDLAIACVALPCGRCFNCRRGETASCLNFGVTYLADPGQAPHFHGGFAEYLFSPTANLVKVPAGLDPDAVAAFACAGPTVIRAFDFAGGARAGELVVVQGSGPVGLFAAAWAARAGGRVVLIGSSSHPKRLALARELGAVLTIDYRRTSEADRLQKILRLAEKMKRGNGADLVFEASGSPAAVPEGLNLVRTLGRYVIPGQYSASGGVEIQPQLITFKAIRITGSGQYKLADIRAYLDFLRKHPDLQPLLARSVRRYRIETAERALEDVAAGRVIKGVFSS
ncbi:MAG TPA: alcohol dehydrogenase catalytic domain-containing protein [bacterium]|nr:alcohol dehydrogenase catalytic domain-containing protein [bacterium]HNS48332.1 alcohol dehydrogenase catalytic domain-containing protein [bacterium]